MILEVAVLMVKPDLTSEFEEAFHKAETLLPLNKGYNSHELMRCIECPSQYILQVSWETIQDHELGFRQSEHYKIWSSLLHHFYDPFPEVYHYDGLEEYNE
jgi:heme-degrading monooxygenase HmoA